MKLLPIEIIKTNRDIKKLTVYWNVEIELEPQEEDISPYDQFEDEKTAKWVCDKYNNGNIWAWFSAKLTVKYKGLEATDYLGGCSYKSEEDFKKDGYYLDMVRRCIEEINKDISDHNAEVKKNFEIRCAKNILKKHGYFAAKAI